MHPGEKISEFIGLSETEAREMGAMYHVTVRTLRRDAITFLHNPREHNAYRINIHVKDGKVTKANYG